MTELASTAPISVHRPDLSQTLRTSNLYSSNKLTHNEIEYESKSDSSSICHSPTWNDISGRKGKTAKREKKRREMELEKERQNNKIGVESTESVSRPKKLSKQPPISNRLSKIKIPNTGIDLGKLSLSRTPSHSQDSHQENYTYVGGLRLREAEETHVQEAIRKIRPCHENRFSFQRVGAQITMLNSSNIQIKEKSRNDTAEKLSTHWDPYYVSPCSSSDSPTRLESDHLSELAETEKLRLENTLSRDSSVCVRNMQIINKSNNNTIGDFSQNVNKDKNNRRIDLSDIRKQLSQSQDSTCNTPEYDMETYQPRSDVIMPMTASTRDLANATKSHKALLSQPEELKMATDHKQGTSSLRQSTENSFQGAVMDTSREAKPAPHGKDTIKSNPKSPQCLDMKGIKNAARSALGLSSLQLSSDFLLDYCNADQQSNLGVRKNYTYQPLPTSIESSPTGLDASVVRLSNLELSKSAPPPSVLDTAAQQFKHTFYDSHFNSDPMNPSLRSSLARSTDSSEEYSTQDELSNITTPAASRPHSMEKSPVEPRREILFPARVESLAVKKDVCKWAPDFKLAVEDCTHSPTDNTSWLPGSSKKIISAKTLPTCSRDKNQEALSHSQSGVKVPQAPSSNSQHPPWSLREGKEGPMKRGLIKRPGKSYESPATVNPNLDSDSKNSSQYLKNARLRINNNAPLPTFRSPKGSPAIRNNVEPFAKMFVVCCSCKYFHDLPSKLYASMAHPGDVVNDENLGVSGVITTSVKCPWCGHGMTTKCCGGYAAVVYMQERLH